MKKCLITGGFGFIGSNFIRLLYESKNEFKIINLDKLTYAGNRDNLIGIPASFCNTIEGDICDKNLVSNLFEKYNFDIVVHFAAESHVDRSIDGPDNFINTNVLGTLNLLECARFNYYKTNNFNFRFLHVSTDEVYGSLGVSGKFSESTPYDPSSPYSASKAASDHLVRAWNKTFGLPTLITNCSNNYGPYQFPEKLIPLIIINCINQKQLPVYGEGQNIRDWLYVDDHCEAIKKVLEKGKIGETYNIGGNNEIKNIDIVKQICGIMDELIPRSKGNRYSELIKFVKDRPGHDFRYAIDSSKIKENLNWTPNETFKTGIRKTIMWYIDNKIWWKKIQDGTYSQERLGELKK
ncbi:MAG: dTDP-glucose 4,6-dehydratase [Candidatus Marinimicrobia bacterium]|nr:dTDP-glucose 4,6-dehydratase [Candidatus Neomarinimicrobiota bacterium]|tara:strand:+ start:18623 stop:19675 length:1053 start_codon:yes stop_codon:yes gene_type:complete